MTHVRALTVSLPLLAMSFALLAGCMTPTIQGTYYPPGGTYSPTSEATGSANPAVSPSPSPTPSASPEVSTLAGFLKGYVDSSGFLARFDQPHGLAAAADGTLYVADTENHRIRKVTPDGVVSTLAGQTATGSVDAIGANAQFYSPQGIALDQSGNLYVADTLNHRIRKVAPDGTVTTFAGTTFGYTDGPKETARFASPTGIALDSHGNFYIADTSSHTIRRIDAATGEVSTVAGLAGVSGWEDGPNGAALFHWPRGIVVDGSQNLFVADAGNHRIRKIDPTRSVTTLAGQAASGSVNATGAGAQFNFPVALAMTSSGSLIVADTDNHLIREVTPQGAVTTYAGSTYGVQDGSRSAAKFAGPVAIAIDASGSVYVGEWLSHRIRKIKP